MAQNPKQVVLTQEQFDSIMGTIKTLQEKVEEKENPIIINRKHVQEHTARMRCLAGIPVIRIGKMWNEFDAKNEREKILMAEIITVNDNGKEAKSTVRFIDFLNSGEQYVVKILKKTSTERQESQGKGMTQNPDQFNVRTFQPALIEYIVTFVDSIYDIEFTEGPLKGKTMTVKEESLNI